MKNKIVYFLLVGAVFTNGCRLKNDCEKINMEAINLWPVNANFKLPPYVILDSTRYGKENLLNYNISSLDSSIKIYASVTCCQNGPFGSWAIDQQMHFQKQSAEFEQSVKSITENITDIDTLKVGYLKYLTEKKGKKGYEGRIFFYRENNFVEIRLYERYEVEKQNGHSMIDCILETVEVN